MNLFGQTLESVVREFVFAPLNYPDLLPNLLPLIVGAVVIELYLGRYSSEELGWNSSVANAIIWVTTGATLALTTELGVLEKYAVYSLIGVGLLIGYLDFFHEWSDKVAFMSSGPGVIYSIAYTIVVVVKTGMPIDNTVLKGALVFVIGVNIVFKLVQMFEPKGRDQFSLNV